MINLKEFKQAVLQKAMQGKLTKQLSSDGNAKDLLVKIANRKRDLVQAGKLKGYSKPLPPVTDKDIPFKIPDNWEWTRLGNICSYIQKGKSPTYGKSNIYAVSQRCVRWSGLNLSFSRMLAKSSLNKYKPIRYLRPNDILWNSLGTGTLGRASLVPKLKVSNLVADSRITVIRLLIIDPIFMLYYLYSNTVQNHLINITTGSTNQIMLNKSAVVNLSVPLPPLAEQQRIVLKVHKCFLLADTIQKERNLHQKFAHDMKQSLLLEAMKGHLTQQLPSDGNADDLLQKIQQKKQQLIQAGKIRRHKKLPPISKDEIPFEIPKNWKWVRIGSIFHEGSQKTPDSNSKYIDIKSINNKTHNIQHVRDITAKNAPSRARKLCQKGNVIYSTTRPYLHNVAIIKEVPSCDLFVSTAYVVMNTLLNGYYLLYVLLSPLFDKQVMNKSTGTTYPAINNTNFKKLLIPLPPLAEQYCIINKLRNIFSKL